MLFRSVPPDLADPRWRPLGDPTEAALLTLALKGCVDPAALRQRLPRRAEIPFDSATKMMATQHGHAARGRICLKGAPEMVLGLCAFSRCGERAVPLDAECRRALEATSAELAGRALRLLAIVGLAAVQVGTVSVGRIVAMVRAHSVTAHAAQHSFDVLSGSIVAVALVWFGVTGVNAPGQRDDPGVTVIMGGIGVGILGIALFVRVLRMLLVQSAPDRFPVELP